MDSADATAGPAESQAIGITFWGENFVDGAGPTEVVALCVVDAAGEEQIADLLSADEFGDHVSVP